MLNNFTRICLHLNRPDRCPDYLYTLMSKCHTHEANKRPTFSDILNFLANEQTQAEYEVFTKSTEHNTPPDAK